ARSFTLDTTAPTATIGTSPAALTTSSTGSFTFSSEVGATLRCDLDGGGFTICTSPKSYPGLADGSHTFRVTATDPAGNTGSPVSYTWAVDTVPPTATIPSHPAALSNASAPSFGLNSNETGSSFRCQLDGSGYVGCASPKSYASVANGSHTFDVEA